MMKTRFNLLTQFVISYLLVLLFPVAIILFYYYPHSVEIVKEKEMEWNAHITDQVMNSMDIFTRYVYDLPSELAQNRELRLYMAKDEDYQRLVIANEMRKYNATDAFIDNIFLYVKSIGFLFSKSGNAYDIQDFDHPGVGYYYENWPLKTMIGELNGLAEPAVRASETVAVSGSNRLRMLTFLLPIPLGGASSPGTVLITVREETVVRMMKSVSEAYNGNFFIFDHRGNRLVASNETGYGDSEEFADLIAGLDGSRSGSGIFRMGGEAYIVSHGVSDRNGWKYVSLVPVKETLKDIRPIQRRTVFLFILILLLEILVIYVSIRKNVHPIKGLVHFASNIFKSSEPRAMNEIDTIRFALDQLSSDNSKLDERVRSTLPVIRDNLLFELVRGHYPTWEAFQIEAAQSGVALCHSHVAVAVLSSETADECIGAAAQHCRLKEETLPEGLQGYFFKSIYHQEIIFISSYTDGFQLKPYLAGLRQELAERLGIRMMIGIGTPEQSVAGVHLSYLQAVRAAEYLRMRKHYAVLVFDEIKDQQTGTVSYYAEQLQSLELFILKNEADAIETVLKRIIDYIGSDGTPPHRVRTVYLSTISVILGGLQRFGQDDRSLLQLTEASFDHRYTIEQMADIMRESCGKLCEFIRGKLPASRTASIEEILAFIEQNGMGSDFSLQLIADRFGMSVSNLSHTFKKKTGQNFKEHIDRLRIQKSIELLRNSDETLESISQQTGYTSTSSFIRSFKKNVGTTPGQYRELNM